MFKKPKFWDQKKSYISLFLFPLTLITISINYLKKKIPKRKLNIKSICVGNIYLGGTGKTPLVIKLFEILKSKNIKVVTAKKFYKNHNDEQLLLKNKSIFINAPSRIDAANEAIKNKHELIIYDDGLQDYKIDYDLKFVCFKSNNGIGNGRLIPAGPLRENIKNLKKYDVVFINNILQNNEFKDLILSINPKIKIFETFYKIKNFNDFDLKKKFICFSGIGDPESFKSTLINAKINVIDHIIFPDHYNYKKKEIDKLILIAKENSAFLITTEKDYIKLNEEHKKKIIPLKIDLEIKKESELIKFIKERLNENN